MDNITITNNDLDNVILKDGEFRDDFLAFDATTPTTLLKGTILARNSTTLKLVPFIKGAVNDEVGIPKAVLTYDVQFEGPGEAAIRAMVSGSIRRESLIIHDDGDGSNIDDKVLDELRDFTLVSIDVQELNILDNQ